MEIDSEKLLERVRLPWGFDGWQGRGHVEEQINQFCVRSNSANAVPNAFFPRLSNNPRR